MENSILLKYISTDKPGTGQVSYSWGVISGEK